MTKYFFILVCLIIFTETVNGDTIFTTKNGTSFIWSKYTEENGNYCTNKPFGKFCVCKDSILTIEEDNADIPKDAHIVEPSTNQAMSSGSQSQFERTLELQRWEREQKKEKEAAENDLKNEVARAKQYEENEKRRIEKEEKRQRRGSEWNAHQYDYQYMYPVQR